MKRLLVLALLVQATVASADERCAVPPVVPAAGFRHHTSRAKARQSPMHRGIDLIAGVGDPVQHIAGKLAYDDLDLDLEDEDVEVFACIDLGWRSIGTARTDHDGRFALELAQDRRLPAGMRDLYAVARGDGTGARFTGYVAPQGAKVVVIDIDGTLTSRENAVIGQVVRGHEVAHRARAPEALRRSTDVIVYVTARGDRFTEITRRWLAHHGFPRGVLRLARGVIARDAEAYKTDVLRGITVPISAGIGNRHTDVAAYTAARIPRVAIYLPEFATEVAADLEARRAIGFADYGVLPDLLQWDHHDKASVLK